MAKTKQNTKIRQIEGITSLQTTPKPLVSGQNYVKDVKRSES